MLTQLGRNLHEGFRSSRCGPAGQAGVIRLKSQSQLAIESGPDWIYEHVSGVLRLDSPHSNKNTRGLRTIAGIGRPHHHSAASPRPSALARTSGHAQVTEVFSEPAGKSNLVCDPGVGEASLRFTFVRRNPHAGAGWDELALGWTYSQAPICGM